MNIAIIGAGFGGLAAAYDLVKAGHKVTIYEAEPQVGGLASGFREPHWDWSVERFYHHWFESDKALLSFIETLGWKDKVRFYRPKTVMYHEGKFYPFDSISSALIFPGLGWGMHKLRFGLVGMFLRLTNEWKNFEKVTAHEWMKKWAGEKVYRTMWEPLLMGKFGSMYQQVNMAWLWARLKVRTSRLGTYDGGMQAFADSLAKELINLGVKLHLNTSVQQISSLLNGNLASDAHSKAQNSILLRVNGENYHYHQCLFTASPHLLAKLAPQLPSYYLDGLFKLKHLGAVVLVLSLRHKLSSKGYYWFNLPKSAGFPFLALVEHTNFVSSGYYANEHILYCGDYLEAQHAYFTMSEEELLNTFAVALCKIQPAFEKSWIIKSWLFRTPYAQPIPFVNHSQHIPAIQTPIPGLFFASMSQVYPWDRGTNFAIKLGREAASVMHGKNLL